MTNGLCGAQLFYLNLATGSLSAEASDTFLNRGLFLSVVGVLCQEAVHEQKSVSTWTVNDSRPSFYSTPARWMDGWMDGFFSFLGGSAFVLL